ncbi:mitogen-activated protein kinase kinase kinase 20-like [Euphorbia lathyris]|uniref:mitogen-activated protein kinase kinase kinase 20-like n=1 Tax=Euphorbia lathyris TaxID=212925 RepID=UPI0033132914
MKRKFHFEQSNGVEEADSDLYNHGVEWHRGSLIGKGGYGSVYIAELKNPNSRNEAFPELMTIKSAKVSASSSLKKEKRVLDDLRGCPYIIDCYGEETTTTKKGKMIYNLLLEYASEGTLDSLIKQSGGCGLHESDVRRYTRCILKGIDYIHSRGYVHCDLNPANVLLVSDENWETFVPKIGDFGLAKRLVKSKQMEFYSSLEGTLRYMAPETIIDEIQEYPCDIWALGCIVLEMLTGKKVWIGMEIDEIFAKISYLYQFPNIPPQISEEAKDFLKGCFVRNPMLRFSAGLLLIHPFVYDDEIRENSDEERVKFLLILGKC